MGRTCGTHKTEVPANFWSKTLKEGEHLEDVCVDGRIVLKWILNSVEECGRN
jgi:hypothetical protein